jgi:peptidoglycan/LPS O-acetylase OafA/YrhL
MLGTETLTVAPIAHMKYRADIDGLRAIAVALVVVFHAFPSVIPGGYVGVDVFFVISGYLITGIIVRELQAGKFSILEFYRRRTRRIFPALRTVLMATLVAGWFLLLPDELERLGNHALSAIFFVSNLTY